MLKDFFDLPRILRLICRRYQLEAVASRLAQIATNFIELARFVRNLHAIWRKSRDGTCFSRLETVVGRPHVELQDVRLVEDLL